MVLTSGRSLRALIVRAAVAVGAMACAAAAASAGCATLMGMEQGKPLPDAGAGATGAGGAAAGGGSGGTACVHATYPAPPALVDAGDSHEFVVALRRMSVEEQADGGAVGLDLDVTCTCQGEGSSCAPPPDGDDCDLPQGRDNAFAHVLELFGLGLGYDDIGQFFTDKAEEGQWSLLLRVRDYNGEASDDRVEVAWFVPSGFGDAGVPSWDGSDVWPVSLGSLEPAPDGGFDVEHPRYVDHHAYVAGGFVVASLPSAELLLRGGSSHLAVSFTGATVIGRIEPTAQGWALREALAAGRIVMSDVFRAISSMRNSDGEPMCTDHPAYPAGKSFACVALDILALAGTPTQPCDAVSAGIAFDADPAALGPVEAPPVVSPGCDSSVDPIHDTCAEP